MQLKHDSTNDMVRDGQCYVSQQQKRTESDWRKKEQEWYLCNNSSLQDTEHPGRKYSNFLNQKETSKASFPKKNGHQQQSK